jgi:hypothetical protein
MAERVYASPEATLGIGRQRGSGFYNKRVDRMFPILVTNLTPALSGAMSSLGIEVGGGTITEQASQKESFSPMLSMSGFIRVGALMNMLTALGYKVQVVGTDPGVAVTDTMDEPARRNRRKIVLADTTGFVVGDHIQIGTVSNPVLRTDVAEVHKITAIDAGAVDEVVVVTIYGTPSGGTFTLTVGDQTTAPLAYNASAAAVQSALEALSNVGVGDLVVTGSAGGPYTLTADAALAGTALPEITGNGDELTGGSGYGANAGLDGQTDSWVDVQVTTEGAAAGAVTLDAGLLFDYNASGTAVKKVDSAKAMTAYFWHIQPSDDLDNDGFSVYIKSSNGVSTFSLLYFDGKASRFDFSFSTGSIATFTAEMKFADVVIVDPDDVTFDTDPAAVTLNNTRGTFNYLGNHVDAPRSITITNAAEIPDDFTLFRYKPQSIIHTGYSLNMTTEGKFVKSLSDKINFAITDQTVSDEMPEYPLSFRFLSQKLIGATSVPYELSLVATDVQYGQYDPQYNTNQFVSASIGMIKIIPSASGERWYYKVVGKATSDTFGSR